MVERREIMNYDIKIDYVNFFDDVLVIGWSANMGFGQLTVYKVIDYDSESFVFDTENMSDEFRNQILEKTVEYLIKNATVVQ